MAKVVTEIQRNAFVKGLITEANPLTFPENASLDEDNFDLELNGSRSRRLGIDYEVGYQLNDTNLSTSILGSTRQSSHSWYFPGGSTNIVLGVIRVYNRLYFVDLLTANPSANLKNSGNYITIANLANSRIQTTVINNYFVIVSEDLPYPIILTYNATTDVVSQSYIPIFIRDLDGVDDGLAYDVRPSTLSKAHKYNLINQGWTSKIHSTCSTPASVVTEEVLVGYKSTSDGYDPIYETVTINIPAVTVGAIECTKSTLGVYPSNADIWTYGKIGDSASASFEKFDPNALNKNSLDNTLVSRGSIILDAFNRGTSRSTLTGITNLPLDRENGKFTTVAAYAGRVFYSGIVSNVTTRDRFSPNYSGYVFFSQLATSKEKLGLCYQENDPTSPNISDLLDTDGGTIQIPEANKIIKLIASGNSLVIFAENGIWELYGDTGGFLATAYQTAKISSVGVSNAESIVDANGDILYWSKTGIHALSRDSVSGRLNTKNISISTIQTYYNNIPNLGKLNARGFYDEVHNHVRWIFNDTDTYSETNYINHYNKELNLDLTLGAFYQYTISSLDTGSPYICDYVQIPGYSLSSVDSDIYVGSDNVLEDVNQVVVTEQAATFRSATYNFLTFKGDVFTFSKYKNTTFYDWVTADGVGKNFDSYLIAGYELVGDMLKKKQVPYIYLFFTRTEDGFTEVGGELVPDNQSGCYVQSQWNWTNSANSNKWGSLFQAYRYNRNYIPDGAGDTYDTGDSVIVTKNKLRGSGRALSIKLLSEEGKDAKILGWGYEITGNSKG